MKLIRNLSVLLFSFFAFLSCQKEYSLENGGGTTTGTAEWEFKEAGVLFKGPTDTAFIEEISGIKFLTIQGTSQDGLKDFTLEVITPDIKPGTYKTPFAALSYFDGGNIIYLSDILSTDEFSITISKVDTIGVTGTFSGKVKNKDDSVKIITDGKFTAKFKGNTVTPPPPGNGQVMLWSKLACSGGPISVKVNNQSGNITAFTAAEPACAATGTAMYTLPAGTYTWKAYCGTDSLTGNVTVTSGNCSKVEINFTAPPPPSTCVIEKIIEVEALSNTTEYAYINTFNAANKVIKFEFVDSLSSTVFGSFPISYPAGRVQVDANQYFVVNGSGRATEFHGYENPTEDTLEKVIVKYTYNAAGQLIKRTQAYEAAPAVDVLQTDFTYTGQNLTGAIIKVNTGTMFVTAVDVAFTYDLAKTVKNFIYLHPYAYEMVYFQSAVNIGARSANIATKATTKLYDLGTGTLVETLVSDFGTYVINANGYVESFKATGDDFDLALIFSGYNYNFKYRCF